MRHPYNRPDLVSHKLDVTWTKRRALGLHRLFLAVLLSPLAGAHAQRVFAHRRSLEADAREAFQKLDNNGDGCVTLSEFLTYTVDNIVREKATFFHSLGPSVSTQVPAALQTRNARAGLQGTWQEEKTRVPGSGVLFPSYRSTFRIWPPNRVLLEAEARAIRVGILIQISHERFATGGVLSGVLMAIREINEDTSLLPDFRLNISLSDSKCSEDAAGTGAFDLLQWGAHAVIGSSCSSASIAAQDLLQYFEIPQISGGSTSSSLSSDKAGLDPYPYFMRSISSDVLQATDGGCCALFLDTVIQV
ncbi:hypothetical protein CYMTET_44166, partial [Cymbomonas tetramitiformis]